MASDADIVRCAAPWPGRAARLLEGLAALGRGIWTLEQICKASGSGVELAYASQILSGLSATGLCSLGAEYDSWFCDCSPAELQRVAQVLDGAEHFRRMRLTYATTELAVTMPLAPSHLEEGLVSVLGRPGGFLSTSAAFARVAQVANTRLVVMTPFIDKGGFRWLRRIFEMTQANCQRILILRNADEYAAELGVLNADWLRAMNISVRDYYLSHDTANGRALPIETFHSKVVIEDDRIAYVGSANFLSSSESVSLETGVLVEGGPAAEVTKLVEAVLRVARAL